MSSGGGCPFPTLAKYNQLFGEAGSRQGLRAFRILGISLMDVFVVLLFAYVFSLLNGLSFWVNSGFMFVLGILVHRMFCVRTTVDRWLFP